MGCISDVRMGRRVVGRFEADLTRMGWEPNSARMNGEVADLDQGKADKSLEGSLGALR